MPPKAASATTRKRKKADDMADSPPKRITRAKANKSAAESIEAPKTTRITTASARIAAEAKAATTSKAPPKTTRTTKRKAKADDVQNVADEDVMQEDKPEPVKTRGRPKKTQTPEEEKAPKKATANTRQTKAEAEAGEEKAESKPKTRSTRSKPATEKLQSFIEKHTEVNAEQPMTTARRTTRARAGTVTSEPEQPAPPKAKGTKKKVTFQDDVAHDKENVPAATEKGSKKPAAKETGLKAKPVRRPAATRTTTRATKAATDTTKTKKTVQPLSPKKVTQVAKSSSISSEDELGKSPVKPIIKTPIKSSPLKKSELQLESLSEHTGPVEGQSTVNLAQSLLASPAKRPPPSPFKDILKESPKRFPTASPMKTLGNVPDAGTQFKDSMKRSPKRLGFTPSMSQSQDAPSMAAPPLRRAALLASPARRPNSPLKVGSLRMPGKTGAVVQAPNTVSALRHMKGSSLFSATPRRLFGTPLKTHKSVDSPTKNGMAETLLANPALSEEDFSDQAAAETIDEGEEFMADVAQNPMRESPVKPPQFFLQDAFSDTPKQFRSMIDEDSEDELQSGTPTMKSPIKSVLLTAQGMTPAAKTLSAPPTTSPESASGESSPAQPALTIGMTPLAVQMSKWFASSPPKAEDVEDAEEALNNDVFLPVGAVLRRNSENALRRQTLTPTRDPTFFDEQIAALDKACSPQKELIEEDLHMVEEAEVIETGHIVPQSQEPEQYGDENAIPETIIAQAPVLEAPQAPRQVYVTPAKVFDNRPKMVYTTSKVPLKACQDDSPSEVRVPKKRSKSLAGPLAELKLPEESAFIGETMEILGHGTDQIQVAGDETPKPVQTPLSAGKLSRDARTPSLDLASIAGSPLKSARKGADAQILRGAVVHVDVHTTEGADASGIFIELLTAMGAKCIKQWTWNPRVSLAAGEDPTASGKVGITHVVFKDGGKRTLQKVREAKGLVLCVGVGWVLE